MDEDMFSSESPVCPDSFLHADTNLHLVQLTRICWAAEWISFTQKAVWSLASKQKLAFYLQSLEIN